LKILILGGGFAGVRCAQSLSRNPDFEVCLIDRKDYFKLSLAQLAALVDPITIGERSRYPYSSFLKSSFLQGEVRAVDDGTVALAEGKRIEYEILVVATGSSYESFPIGKPQAETRLSDRNAFFLSENRRLSLAKSVLIIGGGPVGVELAGEIANRRPGMKICLAHGNDHLLNYLRPRTGEKAHRILTKLGVEVVLNERLLPDGSDRYRSSVSGKAYAADLVFNCVGTVVNTAFMRERFSGSMDGRNLLLVDRNFLVRDTENIYAIGDCAAVDEAKLAIFADSHGEFLARHVSAVAKNKKTSGYAPRKTISVVPIGRNDGIVQLPFGNLIEKYVIRMKTRDFFIGKYRKSHGLG